MSNQAPFLTPPFIPAPYLQSPDNYAYDNNTGLPATASAQPVVGAVFFAMTGMHALHVLSGVILMLIVWTLGRKGQFSSERHWGVEAAAIWWHYVDLVWVFYYPALYLIGTAV